MTADECFKHYEKMLKWIAHKYDNQYEFDDLFQIACIGFMKAFKTYDLQKGNVFSSLLVQTVNNEIRQYHRREKKRVLDVSIYDKVPTEDNNIEYIDCICDKRDYAQEVIEKLSKQEDLQMMNEELNKLKDRDRLIILDYFFTDMTQRQIAQKYNVRQPQISRVIKNTLEKLNKRIAV